MSNVGIEISLTAIQRFVVAAGAIVFGVVRFNVPMKFLQDELVAIERKHLAKLVAERNSQQPTEQDSE